MQGRLGVWHVPLLALAWLAQACEADRAEDGRGGSDTSDDDGDGGAASIAAITASTTVATVVGATGSTHVSGSGGVECAAELFASGELNACANASCCAEMDACAADPASCGITGDEIDLSAPGAIALNACLFEAGCIGYEVCDSGLLYPDPESAECLTEACCAEVRACTRDGADVEACVACMDDAPPLDNELCEDALECFDNHCGGLLERRVEICESELVVFEDDRVRCLEEHCCEAYEACTHRGESQEALEACWDCFDGGGGPLCDAAIACDLDNCDPSICGSGVAVSDPEQRACLEEWCCDAFTSCTGGSPDDEDAVQACIDCIIEGAGVLCDEALACADEHCGGV